MGENVEQTDDVSALVWCDTCPSGCRTRATEKGSELEEFGHVAPAAVCEYVAVWVKQFYFWKFGGHYQSYCLCFGHGRSYYGHIKRHWVTDFGIECWEAAEESYSLRELLKLLQLKLLWSPNLKSVVVLVHGSEEVHVVRRDQ